MTTTIVSSKSTSILISIPIKSTMTTHDEVFLSSISAWTNVKIV